MVVMKKKYGTGSMEVVAHDDEEVRTGKLSHSQIEREDNDDNRRKNGRLTMGSPEQAWGCEESGCTGCERSSVEIEDGNSVGVSEDRNEPLPTSSQTLPINNTVGVGTEWHLVR